jgi:hypothetical protein
VIAQQIDGRANGGGTIAGFEEAGTQLLEAPQQCGSSFFKFLYVAQEARESRRFVGPPCQV